MSEISKNTFEGGINQDIDIALTKGNTILYTENVKIISSENTNYIVTNIKGTTLVGSLKPNYWCKGVRVSNNIAYIVSSEIVNGVPTGRGEIGSFPSPDYSTGNITNDYRPFKNYKGDTDLFPEYNGELNSIYFNFKDKVRLEVEIQQEYDGSVNVIFTDGINPIRIINSGFSKTSTKYKLIERVGTKDTNKYDKNTWNSVMSLVQNYSTLSQVELKDVVSGGSLISGNYTFFFRFSTAEKNKTDIICQTFPISIYSGNSLTGSNTIKGGVNNSNKSIILSLSGLDTSYAFIHVDYILENGVDTVYKSIVDDYPINGTELDITISGGENSVESSNEEVGQLVSVFDYAKTITQIQNRLIPANVGKSERNYTLLRKFAAYIIPKFIQVPVEAKHTQGISGMEENEVLSTTSSFGNGRSWNIGYANIKNNYLRRGYWGGETYSFGIRFIYKDLTASPVFPTFGYDDQLGSTTFTLDSTLKTEINNLIDGNTSGYDSLSTKNINGVYRFPTRTCSSSNSLVSGNGLNTYAISFDIPDLDTILLDSISILDEVVGVEFVRSERIKDCLFQGVGLACYPFHTGNPSDGLVWNQTTNFDGSSGGRGLFTSAMPLIRGVLPATEYSSRMAASRKTATGNYSNDFEDPSGHEGGGAHSPVEGDSVTSTAIINNWNILLHQNQLQSNSQLSESLAQVDGININKYSGIYSPELITNLSELSPIINGTIDLKALRLGRQVVTVLESGINSLAENDFPNEGFPIGSAGTDHFPLENHLSPQLFYVTATNKNGVSSAINISNANYIATNNENLGNFKSYLVEERFIHYPEDGCRFVSLPWSREIKTPSFWGVKNVNLLEDLQGYACYPVSTGRSCLLTYYEFVTIGSYFNVLGETGGSNSLIAPYGVTANGLGTGVRFTDSGEYFNFFNIYQGNGLTSWDNIKSAYSPASLKYTPISQRLFLRTGQKNAVYNSSVSSTETSYTELYYDNDFKNRNSLIVSGNTVSKKPTFWGGDCYIAPYIVKVVSSTSSNRGIYMSVFLESSVNPILLNESDNFPFVKSRLDIGGDLPSESINSGYLKTISKVPYTSLDFNSPFIKVEYDTRVYYSDLHVQNNLKNGYKVFGLLNYKDYTKHLGAIVKVINIKNTLFLIQQTGISVIPFNDRIQSEQSQVGTVYLAQIDVLSQYVTTYSEVYGTNIQFACIPTSDNLYILDLNNFKIITLTPGRGIEFVSDLKLESFIRKYLSTFLGKTLDFTNLDIVGFDHTANHKEIVWTFYDKANPSKLKNISLAYNIALKEFTSFYSMVPYQTFGLDGVQYAFNSNSNPEKIYSLETNPIRNLIFEETKKSIVRFKVSDKYEFEKVFDNISVISNNVLPNNVLYYVDGGNTNQIITYDPINIHLSNAKHREGVTYITIPRVETITDKDATEFLDALYTNAMSQLNTVDVTNEKSRFKGKSIIIELQYSTDKQLRLNSVLTQYRISNS